MPRLTPEDMQDGGTPYDGGNWIIYEGTYIQPYTPSGSAGSIMPISGTGYKYELYVAYYGNGAPSPSIDSRTENGIIPGTINKITVKDNELATREKFLEYSAGPSVDYYSDSPFFFRWSKTNGANTTYYYPDDVITKEWYGNNYGTDSWTDSYGLWAVWSGSELYVYMPDSNTNEKHYRCAYKSLSLSNHLKGAIFTRKGYTQIGWTTTEGGSKVYDLEQDVIDANSSVVILYPVWEHIPYTLRFHPNGAFGEDVEVTVYYGEEVYIPNDTYQNTGYTISIWNEKADGTGSSWEAGETYTYMRDDDVDLYAIWDGEEYTVYYASLEGNAENYTRDTTYYMGQVDFHDGGVVSYEVNGVSNQVEYVHTSKAIYGSPFYTDRLPYPESRMYNSFDGWEADDGTVLTKADAWYDAYTYGQDPTWRLRRDVVIFPRWDAYYSFGKIFFGGKYSDELGIKIEEPPSYVWPEYSYNHQKAYGRNGDILRDNERYENVSKKYKISAYDGTNFASVARKVSEWLHRKDPEEKYMRLEDSYEPDIFRLAVYEETNELENVLATAGKCEITFNCKPQKFLISGETPIEITESGQTIVNPTSCQALPLIKIRGIGSVFINDSEIKINQNFNYMVFDAESYNAVNSGGGNMNSYVYCIDSIFLKPGDNIIRYSEDIISVSITPRWWRV